MKRGSAVNLVNKNQYLSPSTLSSLDLITELLFQVEVLVGIVLKKKKRVSAVIFWNRSNEAYSEIINTKKDPSLRFWKR
jgi:hypothetical protein